MNRKWQHLQPGDIVDIVATSGTPSDEDIEIAKSYLVSLGLKPRIPEDMLDKNSYYFANFKEKRFKQLKEALYAPDSKAIWPIRGGYGAAHLIEDLKSLTRPEHTKLLIGFSDITALHIFFQQFWNWSTVHGPGLQHLGRNKESYERNKQTEDLIFGRIDKIKFLDLIPLNDLAKQAIFIINTTLIGGNLCVIETSLGTDWQIDAVGKILLLEEVGEAGYRIHRMLTHLKQAGIFDNVKAIIMGDMCYRLKEEKIEDCNKFINSFIEELNIPVLSYRRAIGHNPATNPCVPLGTHCHLTLGTTGRLVCESGAKFNRN
jgi:muramoyltetrapeptide carboxypeptidase